MCTNHFISWATCGFTFTPICLLARWRHSGHSHSLIPGETTSHCWWSWFLYVRPWSCPTALNQDTTAAAELGKLNCCCILANKEMFAETIGEFNCSQASIEEGSEARTQCTTMLPSWTRTWADADRHGLRRWCARASSSLGVLGVLFFISRCQDDDLTLLLS
jgi:hypothetical protein